MTRTSLEQRAELERLADPSGCEGIVVRDGTQDACGKPAVAVIDGRSTEDQCFWAACAWHANRYGGGNCVPLTAMLRDLLADLADVTAERDAARAEVAAVRALLKTWEYGDSDDSRWHARELRAVLAAGGEGDA